MERKERVDTEYQSDSVNSYMTYEHELLVVARNIMASYIKNMR